MSTIAERVAAGAAFLDEHDPDWWRADVERAIDLDTLDLHYGNSCVLGQRCPVAEPETSGYVVYGEMLSGYRMDDSKLMDPLWEWGIALGITPDLSYPTREVDEEVDALTAEWRRVIAGRRAAS